MLNEVSRENEDDFHMLTVILINCNDVRTVPKK
jgi:hypothetical protein